MKVLEVLCDPFEPLDPQDHDGLSVSIVVHEHLEFEPLQLLVMSLCLIQEGIDRRLRSSEKFLVSVPCLIETPPQIDEKGLIFF